MKRLLTSSLALAVLAGPALAQSEFVSAAPLIASATPTATLAPMPSADEDPAIITPRLVSALGSASDETRADALHEVVTLAYSTDGADLRPAIPALLGVFQTDDQEAHRLLALRALEASADDDVMATLRREAKTEAHRTDHPAVKRLLFAVLVDHYGTDALRSDVSAVNLATSLYANGVR